MRILVLSLFIALSTYGQELPSQANPNTLELSAERGNGEEDVSAVDLDLFKSQVSINSATAAELVESLGITQELADAAVDYRERFGPFISIFELNAIPGWSIDLAKRLSRQVTVDEQTDVRKTLAARVRGGQSMAYLRIGLNPGSGRYAAPDSGHSGSSRAVQFRYTYRYKNLLQYGITGANQAGEQMIFRNGRYVIDQATFHVFARNLGFVRLLAIGNFKVNMGQGLVCWQGMGFGKSSEVMLIKREAPELQPAATGGTANVFRGVGVAARLKLLEVMVFVSRQRKDAVIENDTVRSLSLSGLHRTAAEIARRQNLGITSAGARIGMSNPNRSVHINGLVEAWDRPILKHPSPYNLYAPVGQLFANLSADYSCNWRNIHLFGEVALNERRALAAVNGLLISLDRSFNLSLLFRRLSPAYYAWNGNAFTDNSHPTNETGVYLGMQWIVSREVDFSAYVDVAKFPWLKFQVDGPSGSRDMLVQCKYLPDKLHQFIFRLKSSKQASNSLEDRLHGLAVDSRLYFRADYQYSINADTKFHFRAETIETNDYESGILLFGETQRTFLKRGLRFGCRVQFTNTDNYNTRLYAYESDVLYSFSIKPQFGHFFRYFVIATVKAEEINRRLKHLSVSVKLSHQLNIAAINMMHQDDFGNAPTTINFQLTYNG